MSVSPPDRGSEKSCASFQLSLPLRGDSEGQMKMVKLQRAQKPGSLSHHTDVSCLGELSDDLVIDFYVSHHSKTLLASDNNLLQSLWFCAGTQQGDLTSGLCPGCSQLSAGAVVI